MGNVIAAGGIRSFVKYMPEFKNFIKSKNGKLNNEFLDEIETLVVLDQTDL